MPLCLYRKNGTLIYLPNIRTTEVGLNKAWYQSFHKDFTKEMENSIKERLVQIIDSENGMEKLEETLKKENPKFIKELIGFDWIITSIDIFWWKKQEEKISQETHTESNLLQFNHHFQKEKKKIPEEKKWKEYWLRQENYYGKIREERLDREAISRRRRCYSEGEEKSDEVKYFIEKLKNIYPLTIMPKLPHLGLGKPSKMEKKKRK